MKTYTRVIETEEEEELDEPDTITMAQATIEENQQKVLKLKAEINALTEKINKLSQDKTDTEALIKTEIEPEREKINTEYVDNSYAVVVKHNALIEAAEQKHAQTLRIFSNLNLAEYYESKFGKPRLVILDQVYDTNLLGILRTANKLISETQDAAKSLVLESAESMKGLGENLYNPNYHSQIIEIHKQLINDLKNIPMRHMSKEGHEAINS